MALNFPASPTNGDTFTDGTTTWQWDGTVWNIVSSTSPVISNNFNTISVSGQDDIVADTTNDTLNLVAGANITIATNNVSDSLTISATGGGGGGGEANQNAFSNVAVSGQDLVAADISTDTLNLVAGTNITITTDAGTDSVTINSTASGGSSAFTSLTDVPAGLTVAQIYEPAIAMLRVDNSGTSAYLFSSHYSGNNPTLYAISGTTIAFDLTSASGHPFEIQDPTSTPYNTGLVHVATDGTVSTEGAAQGKDSGVLYWRIPSNISGNYRYQCQSHIAMVGAISIKNISLI